MDCTRAVADVGNDGLCVGNDRFAATETGGEGEFMGGELFFKDIQSVVIRAGEAVDCLMAVAYCDEVGKVTVTRACGTGFEHPLSHLPSSSIRVLRFVDKDKIKLWEGKVLFQRHVDHVVEVNL